MGKNFPFGENFCTMYYKKLSTISLVLAFLIVLFSFNSFAQNQTGGLVINDLDIDVEYEPTLAYNTGNLKNSQSSLGNGSTTEADIYPGSTVTFEFNLENTFQKKDSSSDEIVIDDIAITVTVEELDDGKDVEGETTLNIELEPEEEAADAIVKIPIPKKVDGRTYNTEIVIEGRGSNGQNIVVNWNLGLQVKKPNHDIRIGNVVLADTTLKCGRSTKLTAWIFNAGRQGEDGVKLEVKNNALGISEVKKDIKLGTKVDSEGDEPEIVFQNEFAVNVGDNVAAGTYPLEVNVYWHDALFNTKNTNIIIQDCEANMPAAATTTSSTTTITLVGEPDKDVKENVADNNIVVLTGDVAGNKEGAESTEQTAEEDKVFVSRESSLTKGLFWPLVIGANLILIIVIAGIVLLVTGKKKE